MKRVVSVVGARPNFMKVAPIHRSFQKYEKLVEHIIVHTGQHYDFAMSDAFFKDLELPVPQYYLGVGSGSHAEQTARIMVEFEKVCYEINPDLVIVVGDVNSTIACALTAVKLGIKVAHIEAGLRSFDRTMPEEINRKATDSICDYCFVTEESAIRNLTSEGFSSDKIYFVGNTMIDSQIHAIPKSKESSIVNELELQAREYVLVTLHRPSNVDEPNKLKELLDIFAELSKFRKIVFPVHPRTRKNLEYFGYNEYAEKISGLKLIEPLGYIDFLALMLGCDFVITDSGGIQEETTALGIPCLTIRTTTERPVTCEIGTNTLIQPDYHSIVEALKNTIELPRRIGKIPQFWDGMAGERLVDIIINKLL
jgi:UDP-N-acetylglucosamine 2-epimerase (non-hydrolysing)